MLKMKRVAQHPTNPTLLRMIDTVEGSFEKYEDTIRRYFFHAYIVDTQAGTLSGVTWWAT